MNIVIADDYQNCVRKLDCFSLLEGHSVTIHQAPPEDRAAYIERLRDADVLVVVRERAHVDAELLAALPRLKQVALVGRHSRYIDYAACTRHGVAVTHGIFASPIAPAELTVALILASRRQVVFEANRMRAGQWPATFPADSTARPWAFMAWG
jgi:D-3-phosphoglycerate dehydrogenase